MSQSLHHAQKPEIALSEAFRVPAGGQLIVIDLKKHQFEKARELYGDHWLGFGQNELYRMIGDAGFRGAKVEIVAKEKKNLFLKLFSPQRKKPNTRLLFFYLFYRSRVSMIWSQTGLFLVVRIDNPAKKKKSAFGQMKCTKIRSIFDNKLMISLVDR